MFVCAAHGKGGEHIKGATTITASSIAESKSYRANNAITELVGRALNADRFDLDRFPILSELPIIERFDEAHPHALLPRGKAILVLLTRAVKEVSTACAKDADKTLRRIAAYVRLRYQEGKSVKDIAEDRCVRPGEPLTTNQTTITAILGDQRRFLMLNEYP